MMIVSPTPVFRWTDNNGNPAVGWQVETYIAGSSTPVDTYTDATGTAENTNPIILDARGEANIWLDPAISYKYVIKNSLGVIQDTIDQIQAGSGGSGGLTRVYYNDSSSIAFSGLGTLATPLSSAVKLSAQPNNALQVRADGLYAMAIGGGGSVAWGSITGNILAQTDLINKFGEYLPLTFSSPQTLTYTGDGTWGFGADGELEAKDTALNRTMLLAPSVTSLIFRRPSAQGEINFPFDTGGNRTYQLPSASGTIALTSQIPSVADYIKKDGTTTTTATIPFAFGLSITGTNTDSSAIRIPDGSWVRPQTAGSSLYLTRGANPGVTNGAILLETGAIVIQHGDGTNALSRAEFGSAYVQLTAQGAGTGNLDYLSLGTNNVQLRADNGAGLDVGATQTNILATGGTSISLNGGSNIAYNSTSGNHLWDNGIVGSTAKYQFNGSMAVASGINLPNDVNISWANGARIFGGGAANFISMRSGDDLGRVFASNGEVQVLSLGANNAGFVSQLGEIARIYVGVVGSGTLARVDVTTTSTQYFQPYGNHLWDGGIGGSTSKYQFGAGDSALNGKARFYATTTETGWIGFDSGAFNIVSVGTALTLNSAQGFNYQAVNNHLWDGGVSASTAKYQFNGSAHFSGQVDFDSNINVGGITTTAGATIGGNVTVGGTLGVTGALSGTSANFSGSIGVRNAPDGNIGLILRGSSVWQASIRTTVDNTDATTWTFGQFGGTDEWVLNSAGVGNAITVTKSTRAISASTRLRVGGGADDLTNALQVNGSTLIGGSLTATPPASITPASNGQMTFELTSNTQLKIKVRGSDGVVREASLTLA